MCWFSLIFIWFGSELLSCTFFFLVFVYVIVYVFMCSLCASWCSCYHLSLVICCSFFRFTYRLHYGVGLSFSHTTDLFFFFLVCHCAPTGIRAQIQIDTWQIQTMEIPRYCDSDQIMVASSPRIVIGAHLQVLVTPPNLVASFFGKRVAILAHGVRNGDCHQVRDGAFLRRS